MARDEADVVVIGSGAGGAPVATLLAQAGARVVVLDRGPYYTARDFTHDEVAIAARDFWVPFPDVDPHVVVNEKGEVGLTNEYWTALCVGGATVHMTGFLYRFQPCDTRLATLTGGVKDADLADWPISFEELVPFYDLAEAWLGISGDGAANPFEQPRRPYPLPPMPAHPIARLIDEVCPALGFHPYPTPRAVLSQTYGGRPACNQCGWCGDFGCENGSKSSMLVTFLPVAEATGRCEIRPRAMVRRIVVGADDKVAGAEYLDEKGKAHYIAARVVCLAASAVESARLLLLSETPAFPKGLANNSSGLVGKNLTFSTAGKGTAVFERAKLIEKLGAADMDLPFLQRSAQDLYWLTDGSLPYPKGGTLNFIMLHRGIIFAAQRLFRELDKKVWGAAFKERMRVMFHEELWPEFELFCEFLPWKKCFVELDPHAKDAFGNPSARIHLAHHPYDYEVCKKLTDRGLQVFRAMSPAPKVAWPASYMTTIPHLQQGTCRFGNDPQTSVLDRNCQAHDVKNLYVTDGSFLPTSGAVPNTLTIIANSLRVAHHLRGRFLRREI